MVAGRLQRNRWRCNTRIPGTKIDRKRGLCYSGSRRKQGFASRIFQFRRPVANYLDLARKLLKNGSGPDLLNVDLIWSPVLEPDLIDLRPYLAAEIALLDPPLLASYSVNGKLVAVPFNVPLGGLEYRTDLLREYGYDHPPRTWDELESMAERIQAGERAKGKRTSGVTCGRGMLLNL